MREAVANCVLRNGRIETGQDNRDNMPRDNHAGLKIPNNQLPREILQKAQRNKMMRKPKNIPPPPKRVAQSLNHILPVNQQGNHIMRDMIGNRYRQESGDNLPRLVPKIILPRNQARKPNRR